MSTLNGGGPPPGEETTRDVVRATISSPMGAKDAEAGDRPGNRESNVPGATGHIGHNAIDLDAKLSRLREYCERNWRIFPVWWTDDEGVCVCSDRAGCTRPGKHPRIKWQHPGEGRSGATSDVAQIEKWHGEWPAANWAVALDDLFVVDVDVSYGGMETYAELEENDPYVLGLTQEQQTSSGGRQLFYRQPPERDVPIVPQGRLPWAGFEIKGLRHDGEPGSYVLVPPSRNRRWLNDREPDQATPVLLGAIRQAGRVSSLRSPDGADGEAFGWERALTPGAVPVGEQQDTLYRAACSLRSQGANDALALANLARVVECFVGDPTREPWRPEDAAEMWDRVKRERPAGRSTPDLSDEARRWADQWANRTPPGPVGTGGDSDNDAQGDAGRTGDDARPDVGPEDMPEYPKLMVERALWHSADRAARGLVEARELARLRPPRVKQTARRFSREPPRSVIMDRILAAEVNLLGGPDQAGKSLLARDWALAVAAGHPWRGYPVSEARDVLWVASEGLHDFADRWTHQPLWDLAADRVYVLDAINLVGRDDVDWLLGEYETERPGLVIFDLIYGMGMADDQGVRDVVPVLASLSRISAAWDAATLAIGHPGHNGERRFRGSSMWRQLAYVDHHFADGTWTCEKSKITNKRDLGAAYRIDDFPNIHWLSGGEVIGAAQERKALVEEDFRLHPNDSAAARCRRLAPVFGVSKRQTHTIVRACTPPAPEANPGRAR